MCQCEVLLYGMIETIFMSNLCGKVKSLAQYSF